MSVAIQHQGFDVAEETAALARASRSTGAVVTFVGLVRDVDDGREVRGLTLEHYPGMAEKEIGQIIDQAKGRWALEAVRVVHRVGTLRPTDPIVYVGVASQHRGDAFRACEFIMDFLKTRAPFWKKERLADGRERWLDARGSDSEKAGKWLENQNDSL